MSALETTTASLREFFRPDGGCPYYPGGESFCEPTLLALLALKAAGAPKQDTEPLLTWLLAARNGDGSVGLSPEHRTQGTWLTAQMAVALHHYDAPGPLKQAVDWLIRTRSAPVAQDRNVAQDNTIPGWPWVRGTFGWVEPTAWAVLGLVLSGERRSSPGGRRAPASSGPADRLRRLELRQSGTRRHGTPALLGYDRPGARRPCGKGPEAGQVRQASTSSRDRGNGSNPSEAWPGPFSPWKPTAATPAPRRAKLREVMAPAADPIPTPRISPWGRSRFPGRRFLSHEAPRVHPGRLVLSRPAPPSRETPAAKRPPPFPAR